MRSGVAGMISAMFAMCLVGAAHAAPCDDAVKEARSILLDGTSKGTNCDEDLVAKLTQEFTDMNQECTDLKSLDAPTKRMVDANKEDIDAHYKKAKEFYRAILNKCDGNADNNDKPKRPALLSIAGAAGVLGTLGIITGAVFGGLALAKKAQLVSVCPDKACQPADKSIADTATEFGTVSTVAFVIGGTGLAVGGITLIAYYKPGTGTSKAPKTVTLLISGQF